MAGEVSGSAIWRGGMAFDATAGTGGSLTIDAGPELGGADLGPRPMELLLLALGGCTGMSVLSILRRSAGRIADYQVTVKGRQRESHPRIFTSIEVEHRLRGEGLTTKEVERAIAAATRFCPVAAMLGEAVEIAESWVLIEEGSGVEIGRG
jgi:putative redox protein